MRALLLMAMLMSSCSRSTPGLPPDTPEQATGRASMVRAMDGDLLRIGVEATVKEDSGRALRIETAECGRVLLARIFGNQDNIAMMADVFTQMGFTGVYCTGGGKRASLNLKTRAIE